MVKYDQIWSNIVVKGGQLMPNTQSDTPVVDAKHLGIVNQQSSTRHD